MDLELKGKRALITGASGGIGRATARLLAKEGVDTVVVARRGEELQSLAKEITDKGGSAPLIIVEDITKRESIASVRDKVLAKKGGIDLLINNLGQARPFTVETPDDDWDEAFELNFTPTRKLSEVFLPGMRERKFGRIVNLSSTSEPPSVSGSATSKGAVVLWAKGLSRTVAKDGVTVNCVTPGMTLTAQILNNVIPKLMPTEEDQRRFLDREIPAGRFADPDDIANLIVFLCSDKASYITGQRIYVDGGWKRSI